jgi:hypothetical protein
VRVQQNAASLATPGPSCRRRRLRLSGATSARYDVRSPLRPLLLTGGQSSRPVSAAAQPTPPSCEGPASIGDASSYSLRVVWRIAYTPALARNGAQTMGTSAHSAVPGLTPRRSSTRFAPLASGDALELRRRAGARRSGAGEPLSRHPTAPSHRARWALPIAKWGPHPIRGCRPPCQPPGKHRKEET